MKVRVYNQRYERGKVCYPLKTIGKCDANKTGTKVTFQPDPEIFEDTTFDFDTLKNRLREMAFLTKGLRIDLYDDREDEEGNKKHQTFHYEGGIKEFVAYLNDNKTPLYEKIMYFEGKRDNIYVEVAMQHNDGFNEMMYGFVTLLQGLRLRI